MEVKSDSDVSETCSICGDTMQYKFTQKLKCGHEFHYDCLLKSYSCHKYPYVIEQNRNCPYCRTKCDYLPLLNGLNKVIPGIHCPVSKKKENMELLEEQFNVKCGHILTKGKRKGEECRKKSYLGYFLCETHFQKSKV